MRPAPLPTVHRQLLGQIPKHGQGSLDRRAARYDKFGVNSPYSCSKLQELVPHPAAATGQFGGDDIAPVIRLACSHRLNLAAGAQYAERVSVTARGHRNIHIAAHCRCWALLPASERRH